MKKKKADKCWPFLLQSFFGLNEKVNNARYKQQHRNKCRHFCRDWQYREDESQHEHD